MLQSKTSVNRNVSIDILKCFAALLITNSHMGILYGKYNFLATGGCIGDALFFFCSGFTLFLKPMNGIKEFPNWYKRRINRLFPPLIAVAFLGALFFNDHYDVIHIVWPNYWFVRCIMLYYVVLFFIGSYLKNQIMPISILVALGTAVWFFFVYQTPDFSIYGGHYIRWLLFFVFMLFGAKLGTMTDRINSKPILDFLLLVLSIGVFYVLFIAGTRFDSLAVLQYFSFIPLLSGMYYFYKVGNNNFCKKMYNNKVGNILIRFIGSLCFEIYLVQFYLFTDKMNHIFPINIFIMFLIIFVVAYLTRCLARFISQTFKDTPYNFREIVNLF